MKYYCWDKDTETVHMSMSLDADSVYQAAEEFVKGQIIMTNKDQPEMLVCIVSSDMHYWEIEVRTCIEVTYSSSKMMHRPIGFFKRLKVRWQLLGK